MASFVRFTTTDDRIIYIDPDNIVMISEHRHRVNDIGYVGSTITFHVGTAASSINVKDDPEAIYHYLRKAELVHDQEVFLSLYHPPQKTRVYKPDGTSYVYPNEQEPLTVRSDYALMDTPAQESKPVPSIEDFIDYIDNHPINRVDKPEPVINLRVRSEPTTYRTPPQEPQVLSSFLVHLFEELNRFYWDTTKKLLWIPQVDDVIVDKEGSTWLVTESSPPTIKAKAIGLHQEVAMFSLDCIAPYFSEHSFDLGVQALIGRKNKRTTPTPPQETPPCNGNGEAQSTEE